MSTMIRSGMLTMARRSAAAKISNAVFASRVLGTLAPNVALRRGRASRTLSEIKSLTR